MGKRLILILGGVRSGKSECALRLAETLGGRVAFVATAEPGDEEMAYRIAKHRADRPKSWQTIEAPRKVGEAISRQAARADVVLIDCLTLMTSNVLVQLPEPWTAGVTEALIEVEIDELLAAYEGSNATWIVISNEVGSGLVPPYPMGRIYRDSLGKANQRLAARADQVTLMVAGLSLELKNRL